MPAPYNKMPGITGADLEFESGDLPRIRAVAGAMQTRTADGTAFENHQVADPLIDDDAVNKRHGDLQYGYRHYDAIVDAGGDGDYLLPSAAFAAGATSVFVRAGTYVETADIDIPAGGFMCGEGAGEAVISLGAFECHIDGTGTRIAPGVGFVAGTHNSTTITGSATTFLSASPGDYINIRGVWHEIDTITSNTVLDLVTAYRGPTFTLGVYEIQSMLVGAGIQCVVFANSTDVALRIEQASHVTIDRVMFSKCGVALQGAMRADFSTGLFVIGCVAEDGPAKGFHIVDCQGVRMQSCVAKNNGGPGFQIAGDSQIVTMDACMSMQNGFGFYIGTGNQDIIVLDGCQAVQNNDYGYKTDSTNLGKISFDSCHACSNGGLGFDLAGAADAMTDCQVKTNSGGGVVCGDEAVISSCRIVSNVGIGVDATATVGGAIINDNMVWNNDVGIDVGPGCVVHGNRVQDDSATGIRVSGNNNAAITGNVVTGSGGDGILLAADSDFNVVQGNRVTGSTLTGITVAAASCDQNIVSGNLLLGNTGANLTDNGTGTVVNGDNITV